MLAAVRHAVGNAGGALHQRSLHFGANRDLADGGRTIGLDHGVLTRLYA